VILNKMFFTRPEKVIGVRFRDKFKISNISQMLEKS